jgi:hypothetical protein
MRVSRNLDTGKVAAVYSDSLIRGTILNGRLSSFATNSSDIINFNSSCVFFAVAFLEAKLNQIISGLSVYGGLNDQIPKTHWEMVKANERSFTYKQKWNFVAAAQGGVLWDAGREPFQSFEVIISLRNELIHFKGDEGDGDAPGKFKKLVTEFPDDEGDFFERVLKRHTRHWLSDLLSSKRLGRWIALKTLVFDTHEKLLLTGAQLTEADEFMYWSKWGPLMNARREVVNCKFHDTASVLGIIERANFPDRISERRLAKKKQERSRKRKT